jgi:hypothetical protein
MTNELLDKLDRFFKSHRPLSEECHVVYSLVEIRKLLDREKTPTFPLLRFYADWSVHTEKDRITPQINTTMTRMFSEIKSGIAANNLDPGTILGPFASMENLRAELVNCLTYYRLDGGLANDGWLSFRNLLVAVLADQPINKPCVGIHKFAFTYAANGRLIAEIIFERTPAVLDRLTLD